MGGTKDKVMSRLFRTIAVSGLLFLAAASAAFSQDSPRPPRTGPRSDAPKVFFDCHQCDMDYIRTEITFVNFVRERRQADVFVMVTIQGTAGGGREYTLAFIGQNDYIDIRNTLKYISNQGDTDDEQRRGLVRVLKVGLVPYAAKTSMADYITVGFERKTGPMAVVDRWNSWVFNVGMSANLRGEAQQDFSALNGHLSINRVTAGSKLRLGLSADYSHSSFDLEEGPVSSTSDSQSFSGLYVVSLDEHWSAGSWLSYYSSSYDNIAFSISPSPAVEYSFFPYSESTRRQLRVLYRIGYSFNKYIEETIFDEAPGEPARADPDDDPGDQGALGQHQLVAPGVQLLPRPGQEPPGVLGRPQSPALEGPVPRRSTASIPGSTTSCPFPRRGPASRTSCSRRRCSPPITIIASRWA